uniref:Uncharacterized protein n=1 Tax=Oryza meridionalis TaxID=40149 RepID=A0A0E0D0K7_9ORYZ
MTRCAGFSQVHGALGRGEAGATGPAHRRSLRRRARRAERREEEGKRTMMGDGFPTPSNKHSLSEKERLIAGITEDDEGMTYVEGQIKNVKDMLETGYLEGVEIAYKKKRDGPVLSAREFGKHALDQDSSDTVKRATHNRNDHAHLPYDTSVYNVSRLLKNVKSLEKTQKIFDEIKMNVSNQKGEKHIASVTRQLERPRPVAFVTGQPES